MLQVYREIVRKFEGLDAKVILYGSVAKGNYRPDSDIDLAIVTDREDIKQQARQIADTVLIEHGKVVSLQFMTDDELQQQLPFYQDIRKEGVIVHG